MSDTPSGAYSSGRGFGNYDVNDEALQMQQLALNARILSYTNPWMGDRPDILMQLATSGLPPDQLATQGAAMFGMQSIEGLADSLGRLSPVAQRSVYGKLTDQQQRALNQLGYNQPDDGQDSWLGEVANKVGQVTAPVIGGISTVAGPPLKGALDVLTWVGDQPAHLYRAIRTMDDWQQWVALTGAVAGVALAIPTAGGSLALTAGSLGSLGILGGAALAGGTVAAAATNPAEWWDAMNSTWDGEKVFEMSAQRDAREILQSDELVNMAKELALEIDPYELAIDIAGERQSGQQQILEAVERVASGIVDPGSAEYQQVYQGIITLVQQEPFLRAVDRLQQGKISFGRDIADAAGMDPNSTLYNLTSGGIDAVWLLSMDPTLAAAKLVKWNRVRRFGVGVEGDDTFIRRIAHLAENNSLVRANFDTIADAVRTGDFTRMPAEARGQWIPINEYLARTPGLNRGDFARKDYLAYLETKDGMRRILEGKATVRGVEHVVLARRSESRGWGRFVKNLRDFRDELDSVNMERAARKIADDMGVTLDFDAKLPSNVHSQSLDVALDGAGTIYRPAGSLGGVVGRAVGGRPEMMAGYVPGARTVGSLIASITSMTPAKQALRIVGDGAEVDIPRFVETMGRTFNMPARLRDEWLNKVMIQGSAGERIGVLMSFQDTALSLGGLRSSPELSRLADKYLHKYRQAFSIGGLDRVAIDGIPVMAGVYPEVHQASLLMVPDMREMIKAVRRGHLLKEVARITDSRFVEESMSRFWKPAVLMRIGFIPRAAGEEGLAWMARMTEGGVAQEFGARSLSQFQAYMLAAAKQQRDEVLTSRELDALKWRHPVHTRPLVRMLARHGWEDPVNTFFDHYGDMLRNWLDHGIAAGEIPAVTTRPGLFGGTMSPQWYHGLLYGRARSWRRMIVEGVDPDLREAGIAWVVAHGDAIMRSTSAMNASGFEKSVVNPDIQMFLVPDPKKPGEFIEKPYFTLRGERRRVGQSDPDFANALSHRIAEPFDDEILAPILAGKYPTYFPGFTDLDRLTTADVIERFSKVKGWTARKLVLEALQPRMDNWRATAEVIRRQDPVLASVLDDVMMSGQVGWDDLVKRLGRAVRDPEMDPADAARLKGLYNQLSRIRSTVNRLDRLGTDSRSWLSAAISSEYSTKEGFYDINRLRAWSQGTDPTYLVTDRDEFIRQLRDEVHAQLMRPENAEHVRRSRFATTTADGRRVAHPMQEGVRRVYVPTSGPGNQLELAVQRQLGEGAPSRARLVTGVVEELLAKSDAYRLHPEFITALPLEVRQQALADAVTAQLARPYSQWSTPMTGVAYDDPRIAQWVSDVLSGTPDTRPVGHNYLDINRNLDAADIDAAGYGNDLGPAGASWRIPESRRATIVSIGTDSVVTLPDGTVGAGIGFDEALGSWADTITRKLMLEHTAGTRETYVIREGVDVRRAKGRELEQLEPGERLGVKEDLFDAEGNPIEFADPRIMDPEAITGDELLWPIVGPMLRDWQEQRGGFTSIVEKSTKQRLGGYQAGDKLPPADQWVSMSRSRADDIHKTRGGMGDLPNVALAEKYMPLPDRWWDKVVRFSFNEVIGPWIDGLVRKPMTFHYFAAAYRENKTWHSFFLDANLFENRIPDVFGGWIAHMENVTGLNEQTLAAARGLAREVYQVDLRAASDADVTRWLGTLADDQAGYHTELAKVRSYIRRNPDTKLTPIDMEQLQRVDIGPVKLLGAAGDRRPADRLVQVYHDQVPAPIWDKGRDAVNSFIERQELGLPLLHTDDQWNVMHSARNNWAHVNDMIVETAKQRALENVVPFLDSHEVRTQFSVISRNLMPFWYAEEQFLKRWAKTMAQDGAFGLATLRKAQLAYGGIRSMGMIRTDVNGKDWFVYPGSGLLGEAISRLPFIPDELPLGVMFQADVQQMMPGLNSRFGTPSFSPWVAMPIDGVTRIFPDAVPIKRALLGDIGASSSSLQQFVPTSVRRVWEAAFGDEDSSRRYAAAMMAAAAMMEAEGNGLPDSATPDQVEGYLDKLRNHARIVMWAQAVTGFVVPGAPTAINTGESVGSFGWLTGMGVNSPDELVSAQYREYIQNLGIDVGTQQFLKDFPNADLEDVVNPLALTVSMSSSESGAPLPATKVGLEWYNHNQGWVDSQPEAGAWFLPPAEADAKFDFYSYNQQLVSGLRKQRSPEDFVRALKYRNAASGYFDMRDQYEQAVIAIGDDQGRKQMLDAEWERIRTLWMAAHPIFAEELVSGEARERRLRTIEQLRYAVTDPQAPDSPSSDAIREISQVFDAYKVSLAQVTQSRSAGARDRAQRLRDAFSEWSAGWLLRNPQLEQLWSAVFRPEASL